LIEKQKKLIEQQRETIKLNDEIIKLKDEIIKLKDNYIETLKTLKTTDPEKLLAAIMFKGVVNTHERDK
jgi:hypothetical protein